MDLDRSSDSARPNSNYVRIIISLNVLNFALYNEENNNPQREF